MDKELHELEMKAKRRDKQRDEDIHILADTGKRIAKALEDAIPLLEQLLDETKASRKTQAEAYELLKERDAELTQALTDEEY